MSHCEKILVIARDRLVNILGGEPYDGCYPFERGQLKQLLAVCEYRIRDEVEFDESFKQLVTYQVLACCAFEDPSPADVVFSYSRGHAGDNRLLASRSIGVGGHVEEADISQWPPTPVMLAAAANRELYEEVICGRTLVSRVIQSYVNDDSSPIGRCHFGLCGLVRLQAPFARSKEPDALVDSQFCSVDVLRAYMGAKLERWSYHVLEAFWKPTP